MFIKLANLLLGTLQHQLSNSNEGYDVDSRLHGEHVFTPAQHVRGTITALHLTSPQ